MYVVITSLRILHDISRTSNMKRSGAYLMWKISWASKQKERKKKSIVICNIISIDDVSFIMCTLFFARLLLLSVSLI